MCYGLIPLHSGNILNLSITRKPRLRTLSNKMHVCTVHPRKNELKFSVFGVFVAQEVRRRASLRELLFCIFLIQSNPLTR